MKRLTGYSIALLLGFLATAVALILDKNHLAQAHDKLHAALMKSDNDSAPLIVAVLTLTSLLLTLPLVIRYLTTGRLALLSDVLAANQTRRLQKIELQLKHLRSASSGIGEAGFQNQREAVKALKDELREELTKEISGRLHAEVLSDSYTSKCREAFKDDERRLRDQIDKLRYRSNLNLAFGVGTTLVAMAMLGWTVLGVSSALTDNRKLTAYFVSRISTVVFVEVFSFFFLRLYRATLDEEKYYQNEMTARSARYIALETSFRLNNDATSTMIVQSLANFKPGSIPAAEAPAISDPQFKDIAESAAKILLSLATKTSTKD